MAVVTLSLLSVLGGSTASLIRPSEHGRLGVGALLESSLPSSKRLEQLETAVLSEAHRGGHSTISPALILPLLDDMESAINTSHTTAQTNLDNATHGFETCSSTRTSEQGEADAARSTTTTERTTHMECRQRESGAFSNHSACDSSLVTLRQAKEAACGMLTQVVKTPALNLIPNSHTDWVPWLTAVRDWADARLNETAHWQSECDTATGAWTTKRDDCEGADGGGGLKQILTDLTNQCNLDQVRFESAACTYAERNDAACSNYAVCYESSKVLFDAAIAAARTQEEARKHEWWMVRRIKCYIKAMDGGANEAAMNACKTTDHNTNQLTLNYPSAPSAPAACTPTDKPCSPTFISTEYGNMPANTAANQCTECPGTPVTPVEIPRSDVELFAHGPEYDSRFVAEQVLDPSWLGGSHHGQTWLSPGGQTSWLTLKLNLQNPRVAGFNVLNTCNTPYNDRSTKDYRISVSADNTNWHVAKTGTLTRCEPIRDTPLYLESDVPQEDATYIKFEMLSYYGASGGLNYFFPVGNGR